MENKINQYKKYIFLLVAFFIVFLIVKAGIIRFKMGHRIRWHDHALELEVKRNMGRDRDIWTGDLKDWSGTLEIIGEGVYSLEDLRQVPGIERLYLRDTSVTDLSPLESMPNLYILIIDGGKVENLDLISDIKSLVYVALNDLPVTSIEPLAELDNLGVLNLSNMKVEKLPSWGDNKINTLWLRNLPIKSIEEIRSLKRLYNLKIEDTKIEDVSALKSIPGLANINLKGRSIKSISDLSRFTQLRYINICNTSIEKIPNLPENLWELHLRGNQIVDFSLEKPIKYLRTLEISNIPQSCSLGDMNILRKCPKVSKLYLSGGHVHSLDELDLPSALTELRLSDNHLTDIDGIEKYGELQFLDLSNNPVDKFDGLEQLPKLKRLNLSGINLSDKQTQEVLTQMHLTCLRASSCKLTNLDCLKNSPEMERLYLSNNRIQDINEVAGLDNLSFLDISYNPITSLDPLKTRKKCVFKFTLDVSGIDIKEMNEKQGENELQIKGVNTLIASNCNLDSLDFVQSSMSNIDVSNNHIEDVSVLNEIPNNIQRLDLSGNPITEPKIKEQLSLKEIYPGVCFGNSDGPFQQYWQVKVDKDSKFLEAITDVYP